MIDSRPSVISERTSSSGSQDRGKPLVAHWTTEEGHRPIEDLHASRDLVRAEELTEPGVAVEPQLRRNGFGPYPDEGDRESRLSVSARPALPDSTCPC